MIFAGFVVIAAGRDLTLRNDGRRLSETGNFVYFTSGASCEANGAGSITTLADCEAAAIAFGAGDTTAEVDGLDGSLSYPSYCYYSWGSLKFNSAGTNTGSCGNNNCICLDNALPAAPPAPPLQPVVFTSFTSGASCEANGAGAITTLADCEAAAAALGLSDTVAVDDDRYDSFSAPPYCFYTYIYQQSSLRFNSAGTHTGSCSSGTYGETCICWVNAPPVPPTLPPLPPTLPSQSVTTLSNNNCLRSLRHRLDQDARRLRVGRHRARPRRHDGGGRRPRRLLELSALLLLHRHQRAQVQLGGHEHRRLL